MRSKLKNPIKLLDDVEAPELFEEEPSKPKKPFKTPFGDLFFTIINCCIARVIMIHY